MMNLNLAELEIELYHLGRARERLATLTAELDPREHLHLCVGVALAQARVALLTQRTALFPHLDVRRNLDYGRRRSADAGRIALDQVVDLLDGHCGHLSAARLPAMRAAQRARDASMALALQASGKALQRSRTSGALGRTLAELTEREQDVMRLVIEGKPNKLIADALDISVRTVEVHRSRVFEKMDVRSAVELANLLREVGPDA